MYLKNKYFLPKKSNDTLKLGNITTSSGYAIECSKILKNYHGLILIITPDIKTLFSLKKEIEQFTNLSINYFPNWGVLPYDNFSPNQNTVSLRISVLDKILNIKNEILIVSLHTIMQFIFPKNFLEFNSLVIKKNQSMFIDDLEKNLKKIGYRYVNKVLNYGEYKKCKSSFDVYSTGNKYPYKINILNNLIDNICVLDFDKKKQLENIIKIKLLPVHEIPVNKLNTDIFFKNWHKLFDFDTNEFKNIYKQLKLNIRPIGIDFYQPLFFNEKMSSLFDFLPKDTLVIMYDGIEKIAQQFWKEIKNRYNFFSYKFNLPLLKPETLWLQPNDLFKKIKNWPKIILSDKKLVNKTININLEYQKLPNLVIKPNDNNTFLKFQKFISCFNGKIIFSVKENNRIIFIKEILSVVKISPKLISCIQEINDNKYYFMIGACDQGFIDIYNKYALICENDFLDKNYFISLYKNNNISNKLLFNLSNLKKGELVVHIDHGIGRYLGLSIIEHNKIKNEYLVISYFNNDKLYVPVSSLYLINRYSNFTNKNIVLDKLGNESWIRSRKKVVSKIKDIATQLLNINAKRLSKKGYCFNINYDKYELFCKNFSFKLTSDQLKAINEVLNDMCQPIIMDRLICGDVGFGKTEIAMRATYLAVTNKKQVAILVPTTLLVQQHYDNFCNRFANFSVSIGMLSRLLKSKEQKKILENVKNGKIDILIGTHKILSTKVKWFDLKLLIIDEEHRFGVNHKEKIKSIYNNIDILTLTATPIPRTLNIVMSGIRDLSLIKTPPENRLSIKTFVCKYDDLIVREAILREILRGGQVFYIYNNIDKIEKKLFFLKKLVPEAKFCIIHSKINECFLEKIMHDFYHQRFNVLICTTIIENGIDIPNVNSILIEEANNFGLSQLHQLRGRVGRSHHQAYAWFLITSNFDKITVNAEKRLKAISSLDEIGSGFDLSSYDLEIRGAGKILGLEQSGQIDCVGSFFYMEILNNAINSIKNGDEFFLENTIKNNQVEIELNVSSLLPHNFVPDTSKRIFLYKKITNIESYAELKKIKNNIINNYGCLPIETQNLISIAKIRLIAKNIGISRIEFKGCGGYFEFLEKNTVKPEYIVNILNSDKSKFKLDTSNKRLTFSYVINNDKERIKWVENLLFKLYN